MSVEDIVLVYPDDFPAIVGINTFSFVKGNWVLFFPDFFFFFVLGQFLRSSLTLQPCPGAPLLIHLLSFFF